ncbi:hypothetical protein AGMMS49938_13370 [Fibrobacterales bacterium]|nr:hypothetical protein AGMMS49938_13370 [Fibrobacterales bacterium]
MKNITRSFTALGVALTATHTLAAQFPYNDPDIPKPYAQYEQINAYEAWELQDQFATDTIKVGVTDTGVKDIADLAEIIRDGYDFFNFDDTWSDDEIGHGTKVASVIGAVANNEIGIAGIARKVKIVPMQIAIPGKNSVASGAQVDAVIYAEQNQIPIINASTYGYLEVPYLVDAIKNYYGLVVFCAGNEGTDLNVEPYHPQVDKVPNTIIVGGTDIDLNNRYNYGAEFVDIGAPARGIITLNPQGTAAPTSGTSFSAPLVAGTLAAMLSINPKLTSAELKEMLLKSAKKIPALETYYRNGNFLDVSAALKAAAESAGYNTTPIFAENSIERVKPVGLNRFSVFTKDNKVFVKDRVSGKVWGLNGNSM